MNSFNYFYMFFLFLLTGLFISSTQAFSHGSMTNPVSRIYNCFLENPEDPKSESCKEAVAVGGKQALYDWNGVNQGNANDMHMDVIPDGQLCGGGQELFKGLNLARNDWFTNNIAPDSGGNIQFVFRATAPHSTKYFNFFITKDGYDPLQPLAWSDLESAPFCSVTQVDLANGNYVMNCPFPVNKSGKHVIYNIWQRDDSQEAFYTCIDVNIEEGVTGSPFKSIGLLRALQDLSLGDKVKFRLFDESFSDLETITLEIGQSQTSSDDWLFALANKINNDSQVAKAGVLNSSGDIVPVKSSLENMVYIPSGSNYTFQVDIEMVNNPGGEEGGEGSCSCCEGPGTAREFDFEYPDGIGTYEPGTVVKGADGNLYECRPFPNSGWCNIDNFYYVPGTGIAWQDAWIKKN
ncbi:MAG: lytic polysaccharide monooxygenase [Thermodesulfobacteriota bacterium]